MKYQARDIDQEQAPLVIERLIMTQHPAWRPDNFVITEYYFGWELGVRSKGSGIGAGIGGVGVASTSSTTRSIGDRVYYDDIAEVKLLDWQRKFKQWYIVSLYSSDGKQLKPVLRTRNFKDAQMMVDALRNLRISLPTTVNPLAESGFNLFKEGLFAGSLTYFLKLRATPLVKKNNTK